MIREPLSEYIFLENLSQLIFDLQEHLVSHLLAVIARELTKVHESVYEGTLAELGKRMNGDILMKGEFVVMVAGNETTHSAEDSEVVRVYDLLAKEIPAKKSLALTASITGASRNRVYSLTRGG